MGGRKPASFLGGITMTIEEIYNKIASHMIEGVMYHSEFAKACDFLGLWGFAKCHMHHQFEEEKNYCCLSHYYATHCFKLLKVDNIPRPEVIPESWYKYSTYDVDVGTKRNAVKEMFAKWMEWEKTTKNFYEEMRHELTEINELDAAMQIDCYIRDVSKELCHVEKKIIKLETLGYDIGAIINMSEIMEKKYNKKLGW